MNFKALVLDATKMALKILISITRLFDSPWKRKEDIFSKLKILASMLEKKS